MAREEFERQLDIAAPPLPVWETVTDIARLVDWVGVLEEAVVIEPLAHYRAVLRDRLGMFSLRADLDIKVTDYEKPTYLRGTAEGEDRQVDARIAVELDLRLVEKRAGTSLEVRGTYEVTGRVATLGGSTIRRKSDKIFEEFFGNLSEELA